MACQEHIEFQTLIRYGKSTRPPRKKRKVTAADWRKFAAEHNAAFKATPRKRKPKGA